MYSGLRVKEERMHSCGSLGWPAAHRPESAPPPVGELEPRGRKRTVGVTESVRPWKLTSEDGRAREGPWKLSFSTPSLQDDVEFYAQGCAV